MMERRGEMFLNNLGNLYIREDNNVYKLNSCSTSATHTPFETLDYTAILELDLDDVSQFISRYHNKCLTIYIPSKNMTYNDVILTNIEYRPNCVMLTIKGMCEIQDDEPMWYITERRDSIINDLIDD